MTLDSATLRQTMVDTQVRVNDVPDPALQAAMLAVPREAYCGPSAHLAYADAEAPYAPGRVLLRPRDVAKLLYAARPKAGERALAIAAPYAGAVLQAMGLVVDHAEPLDAVSGAYDVIICEGAVGQVPATWTAALAIGGRLAVIVRNGAAGTARVYVKSEDDLGFRSVFDAAPPVLPGLETPPGFAF